MKIEPTTIPDVLVIVPDLFEDERGFFMETYQAQHFNTLGITAKFVQDNHSGSVQACPARFALPDPAASGKTCASGSRGSLRRRRGLTEKFRHIREVGRYDADG